MSPTISILIISYNRPDDLLELLSSLRDQLPSDQLAEILVLNNASTVSYDLVKSFINENKQLPIEYTESPENLGVSRGRNRLMAQAKGDWLLVLDDDILFREPGDLRKIAVIPASPLFVESNTAVVTFRVIYQETKEQQKTAFPHKQYRTFRDRPQFLTYYFAGCAHLMKREALAATGLYPEDFFYGMEEYDLSYRLIDAGYSLGYDGSITFEHKESPKGRQPNYQKLSSQWINKSKISWRYLPHRYYLSTMIAWSFEYMRKVGGHWATYFQSWKKVLGVWRTEKRRKVSPRTMSYLRKVKARLWY